MTLGSGVGQRWRFLVMEKKFHGHMERVLAECGVSQEYESICGYFLKCTQIALL